MLNLLVKHRRVIFEQDAMPEVVDETRANDIEALMHIFQVGQRVGWPIYASHKSLAELSQTPDATHREEFTAYGTQLVETVGENVLYANDLGRRLIDAPFTAALPDAADRELIGNAIGLGCDIFCTCDRRTIIKKRDRLRMLPIRILTPPEWWRHVKPWAGLWF